MCLAKVAARVGGRLRAGCSPPRFDVIGVIRQPGELDCSSGVSEGNGDVDVVYFCVGWAEGGPAQVRGPITDEGVAVGGAFDSDTATGLMPIAHLVAGVRSFP